MDTNAPLRGADPVNNEFEVGYDAGFEHRWTIAERVGRVVMALFAVAALLGLFGRGPLSHRSVRSADGTLAVDFEPLSRYGTGTQVTLHLSAATTTLDAGHPPQPNQARVFVSTAIVEPMGLQYVLPQPARTEAQHNGIEYTFNLPPGEPDALVRFMVKPVVVGPVQLSAHVGDQEGVRWTQWVLP